MRRSARVLGVVSCCLAACARPPASLVLSTQAELRADPPPPPAPPDPGAASGCGLPLNLGFPGVVCFRGNAQRNYYGRGPVPTGLLRVRWRRTIGADPSEPQWNGVGWTGQPLVAEWPDDVRRHMNFLHPPGPAAEVIVAAMDSAIHFYDAETGQPSRQPLRLPQRNPIKGTASLDPRGYPLLYVGCALPRQGAGYRVFSLLDGKELLCLPGRDKDAPRRWPAFDSNALVLEDRLLLVGENGLYYDVALHTRWDPGTGELGLDPQVTKVKLSSAGVESSLALWDGHLYCGDNHGDLYRIGLASPHEVAKIRELGDDADSTCTFDGQGAFYVGIELDRRRNVSQATLFKLRAPDGELLWRWDFTAKTLHGKTKIHDINGGLLSTPAVWPEGGLVFVTTAHHPKLRQGSLVALDAATGQPRWSKAMRTYAWSSPVVVDGKVVAVDASGTVYVRDAATGATLLQQQDGKPAEFFALDATVEGTPLVWKGRIYLGVRGGALACIDAEPEGPTRGERGLPSKQGI